MIKDSFDEIFKEIKRVLAVFGHPDDLEIICGGTVARLIENKRQVRLVATTNGGRGFKNRQDIAERAFAKARVAEQIQSGLELGIPRKESFNLQIPDGEVETSVENIGQIAFHIREFKPDIVITHHPAKVIVDFSETSHWIHHRDHRNTGLITVDAVYPCARDRGFFPHHFKNKGLSTHAVHQLLLSDSYNDPNVKYFNIDQYLDKKRKALLCHKSISSPETVKELIEENKFKEGYFEPLGFLSIY